jgi:gamma-glutamyl:cysteine ligase YbdK (ATP-grasp superfamily)
MSTRIVLAYVVLSSHYCGPIGIGVDVSKRMTDQIVDFACEKDLDHMCCVTGPLSDEYRSSHSDNESWTKSMDGYSETTLFLSYHR